MRCGVHRLPGEVNARNAPLAVEMPFEGSYRRVIERAVGIARPDRINAPERERNDDSAL